MSTHTEAIGAPHGLKHAKGETAIVETCSYDQETCKNVKEDIFQNSSKTLNNFDRQFTSAAMHSFDYSAADNSTSHEELLGCYDTIYIGGPLDTIQEIESMPSLSPPSCSPISSRPSSHMSLWKEERERPVYTSPLDSSCLSRHNDVVQSKDDCRTESVHSVDPSSSSLFSLHENSSSNASLCKQHTHPTLLVQTEQSPQTSSSLDSCRSTAYNQHDGVMDGLETSSMLLTSVTSTILATDKETLLEKESEIGSNDWKPLRPSQPSCYNNAITATATSISRHSVKPTTTSTLASQFLQHDYRRVWVSHPTLGFAPGTVVKNLDEGKIVVSVDHDNIQGGTVTMNLSESLPVHPSCLQGVPDLLALGEFDLGPLLHNIRVRYFKNEIYSSIGLPILISVNPYKPISNLYSSQTAAKYRNVGQPGNGAGAPSGDLPPHPFLIAQTALSNVICGMSDQSIIISGESGAGKTEATKIILSYLAGGNDGIDARALGRELGQRSTERLLDQDDFHEQHNTNNSRALSVEAQITRSNPVLESFGNAKTLRNDNSSRFGKFTQIIFDITTQKIAGARVLNYLLEKSRIVIQQQDERNYHIFYQLCTGRSLLDCQLQKKLSLDDPECFYYLSRCTYVPGNNLIGEQLRG